MLSIQAVRGLPRPRAPGIVLYELLRDAIVTCNQKLARASLICRTEPRSNKELSYRRGTARCVVSVEILTFATHQCSTSPEQIEVMKLEG